MPEVNTNFAVSTVATAPSPAASGTSLTVASGHGTRFPDPAVLNFNCVVCPAAQQPTPDNAEIVRVTAKSTDTFTITRTQESTSARTIVVGDRIFAGITAAKLVDQVDLFISTGSRVAASTVNAKGDVFGASADDTAARIPAASVNGHALVADSAQASGNKFSGQLDRDNGQPGIYAPPYSFTIAGTALVSNTLYLARFVPTRDMTIVSMQCVVSTLAGASTDQVEMGIGTPSGTSLNLVRTTGSVNSGFNTAGRKSFNLTSSAALTAGTTYYTFFIATSTASLIQAGYITTSGGQFPATTLATGAEVYSRTSGLTPGISFPATSITNGVANVPLLFLHE